MSVTSKFIVFFGLLSVTSLRANSGAWDESSILVWRAANAAIRDADKAQVKAMLNYYPFIQKDGHLRSILLERVLHYRFYVAKQMNDLRERLPKSPMVLHASLHSAGESTMTIAGKLYDAGVHLPLRALNLVRILNYLEASGFIRWDETLEIYFQGDLNPRKITALTYAFLEKDFGLARRILKQHPDMLQSKDAAGLTPLDYARRLKISIPIDLTK